MLQLQGYRTASVATGAAALASIAFAPPDLVIIGLPAAGACDVAREVKANPSSLDIPVIMVSERGDRDVRLDGLRAGVEEFLVEPLDRDELGLRVRNLLRLKTAGDVVKNYSAVLERQIHARTADLRRFRNAMDFTQDLVTLVSRATMRYTEVNAATCLMFGRTRSELLTMGPGELGIDGLEDLEPLYDRIIRGQVVHPQEVAYQRHDGTTVHLEVNRHALHIDGGWSIVAVSRDITERKQAQARLAQLAHYDSLTGLPNRRLFRECLQRAMGQATALGQQLVLMYLDLDGFKEINDSVGHAGGDELLRRSSDLLRDALHARDFIGRLGGDEFGIILVTPNDAQIAMKVARRIQKVLGAPFDIAGHSVSVAASIGITLYPADSDCIDDLERNADLAMYDAKRSGRNEARFYTAAMNHRLRDKLELDRALKSALDNHEFELHYQPKVSLRTGRWVGAEALLRWNRPGHGLVAPGSFIGALEDTGLIVPVGAWVVEQACRQLAAWAATSLGPMPLAVNVSALQIARPSLSRHNLEPDRPAYAVALVSAAKTCMTAHGVEPGQLELEITETAVMSDAEHNNDVLRELKSLGVRLAVDDFGTGYSSLAYLRRFPLDSLKIDGSFVRHLTTSAEDASITVAVIEMAHRLNLRVIAECVETQAQADFLRANGCDEAQGHFVAKPMTADDFAAKWHETAGIAPGIADRVLISAADGMDAKFTGMPIAWVESIAFETALLEGDRAPCRAIMEARLAQGHALVEVNMHIVQPALYRIGQKWFVNDLSVAEEHLATGTATTVMANMMCKVACRAANGRRLLLACVEGNHHAIGLQMVADAFLVDGWDVCVLGANVPTEAVVRHVAAWRPDVLGLSVSLSQQLPCLAEVMTQLRERGAMPYVMVGGLATVQVDGQTPLPGADAWAGDCATALAVATSLCDNAATSLLATPPEHAGPAAH